MTDYSWELFVCDYVFFQKDQEGNSVVTLAHDLGLKNFLKFCFDELVLKYCFKSKLFGFNKRKLSNLQELLAQLDSGQMTEESLWLFGFAFTCEQEHIWRMIAEKKDWQKNWIDPNPDSSQHSLLLIATLLGHLYLAKYVINGLTPSAVEKLLEQEGVVRHILESSTKLRPLGVAAINKQIKMINYLQTLSKSPYQEITLAYFYTEHRDLDGLRQCGDINSLGNPPWGEDGQPYTAPSGMYFSLLGLAVFKNWKEGIEYLLDSGAPIQAHKNQRIEHYFTDPLNIAVKMQNLEMAEYLIHKGAGLSPWNAPAIDEEKDPAIDEEKDASVAAVLGWYGVHIYEKHTYEEHTQYPLTIAIENGHLEMVKLLIENGAPLTKVETKVNGFSKQFPLITAILHERQEHAEYLFARMDIFTVLYQLESEKKDRFTERCQRLFKAFMIRVVLPTLGKNKMIAPPMMISSSGKKLPKICYAVWAQIAGFLGRSEFLNMVINRDFIPIVSQQIVDSNFGDFAGFKYPWRETLSSKAPVTPHILSQFYRRHDTLIDKTYIELFYYVTEKQIQKAIKFIQSRIGEPHLADMIFFQKDGHGDTVINVARRQNLQELLDFCFEQLIKHGSGLENRVVKTESWPAVLINVHNTISLPLIWMYACAFICNQKQIEKSIYDNNFSEKTPLYLLGVDMKPALAIVAALLGNLDLMKNAMNDFWKSQETSIHSEYLFEENELYLNNKEIRLKPLEIAAISRNKEMIQYLLEMDWKSQYLAGWYIERRDLRGLQMNCFRPEFSQELQLSPQHFNIHLPENFSLTPIGLAVAKNWLEGVEYMVDRMINHPMVDHDNFFNPFYKGFFTAQLTLAFELGHLKIASLLLEPRQVSDGNSSPELKRLVPRHSISNLLLLPSIRGNRLDSCRMLVEQYGISLGEKIIQIAPGKSSEEYYPLVYAILCGHIEIARYILKKVGEKLATAQLGFGLSGHQGSEHLKIKKFYTDEISSSLALRNQSITLSDRRRNQDSTIVISTTLKPGSSDRIG